MNQTASIVERPDIELVVCRADEFPAGIKESWDRLEGKLPSLKGRKFYGLTLMENGQLAYYAGVEPINNEKSELGFPTMKLSGGKYARIKLINWAQHTEQIKKIFNELMENYKKDPNGPSVEFYRSQTELHIMIPLAES